MVKDNNGIWSYTTAALKPEILRRPFPAGRPARADTRQSLPANSNQYLKTYFEVPGDVPGYWAMAERNVPHAAAHEHYYNSAELKATRRFLVYTPPGYSSSPDRSYPVLYLYHGAGDDERMWTRVGTGEFRHG